MGVSQVQQTGGRGASRRERDLRFRSEQAELFAEILRARDAAERRFRMKTAVQRLIDACEAYAG